MGVLKMKVRVYQINTDRDTKRLAFMGYEFSVAHGWNPELYDIVYDGDLDAHTLDDIFTILNIGERPKDYKGHSLSVSDIVEIVKENKSTCYYCDSFGWVPMEFDTSRVYNPNFKYEDLEEAPDPCEGCQRFDAGYNCKHCKYGDDGDYSIYDVYRPEELI